MQKVFKKLKGAFLGVLLVALSILCLNTPNISAVSNFTSTLVPSKTQVKAGDTFTVAIVVSGLDNGLASANYDIGFNYSLFTYVSTSATAVSSNLASDGVVKLGFFDATGGDAPKQNGTFATLTFTAKSHASSAGDFTLSSAGTKNKAGVNIISSNVGTTVTSFIPSTSANLASLSLSSGSLSPAFSAGTTSYTATVDASSVSISATAVAGATLVGTGTKNLSYGNNSFNIIVTAEDGVAKKTYTVVINRPDNRSSNKSLKTLSVSGTDIKFNGGASYTSTVEHEIVSVDISATASDPKAVVAGTGKKNLQVGSNIYQLTVTAENGSQQVYSITIIRKAKSGEELNLSKVNTLESLTIEGVPLDFDSKKLVYNLSVENNIAEIKLNYKLSDKKSSAVVEGKTALDVGSNKINIIITAENGETRTYSLYIERKPVRTVLKDDDKTIIAEIDNPAGDPQIFIKVDNASSKKIISAEVLKQLSSSGKTLTYEVVNSNGGTTYSVTIDGSKLTVFDKPFDFTITFKSNHSTELKTLTNGKNHLPINIKHDGQLPAGITIKVFVSDKFTAKGKTLALYYFDVKANKLELVQKDVKVIDGYIKLQLDHASEYVLLDDILTVPADKKFSWVRLILSVLVGLMIIVGLTVLIMRKRKKAKTALGETSNISATPTFNATPATDETSDTDVQTPIWPNP